MNFLPGDKVSFINEKQDGVVVKLLPGNKILVAIEDGFEIEETGDLHDGRKQPTYGRPKEQPARTFQGGLAEVRESLRRDLGTSGEVHTGTGEEEQSGKVCPFDRLGREARSRLRTGHSR